MLQLLDLDTQCEVRNDYLQDKLFGTLFPGLAELERMYGELSPTMVWRETLRLTERLKRCKNKSMEVIQIYNNLLTEYQLFTASNGTPIKRTPTQAEYTTICVLTCLNFRLVARPDELTDEDTEDAIMEILDKIGRHPVHAHLYQAQRKREEVLDKRNRKIERIDCLEPVKPKKESSRVTKMTDGELDKSFSKLFLRVTFAEWVGLVNYCESHMSFTHKIDRVAYLMFAVQKSWMKSAKTIDILLWTTFMNNLLDLSKRMTQTEVSRKYNAIKSQPFFDSYTRLLDAYDYEAPNLALSSFKTLRENVKLMHQYYNDYKKLNENTDGE